MLLSLTSMPKAASIFSLSYSSSLILLPVVPSTFIVQKFIFERVSEVNSNFIVIPVA